MPIEKTTTLDVLNATCRRLDVSPDELRGPSREYTVRRARQIAAYLIRKHVSGPPSFDAIARNVGRTRSTVIHATKKVEAVVAGREIERELLLEVRSVERDLEARP